MGMADPIGLVEAAYDLDADRPSWMRAVAEHAIGAVPGATSGMCYEFDISEPSRWFGPPVCAGRLAGVDPQLIDRARSDESPYLFAQLNRRFRRRRVATLSELVGKVGMATSHSARFIRDMGAADTIGCIGVDAEQRGLAFCTDLSRVTRLSPSFRRVMQLVAVHVAAAHRLRRRLGATAPDLVLSPAGRLLHAQDGEPPPAVREKLRVAVLQRDRARTRKARATGDGGKALSLWSGLVAGRWSLVDRFEGDGRRYVVACRNEPDAAGVVGLSARERQVIQHLVLGDSMKLTGYALGIAPSAVSEAARGALRKLRVRSIAELASVLQPLATAAAASTAASPRRR